MRCVLMQIQDDTDSFKFFPYPSDGKENKGGFDLIKNPEKIDEITEFKKFPELRRLIEFLNFESKRYRSFGCDGGIVDSGFTGYIEFAFRESEQAKQFELYRELIDGFERYLIDTHTPEETIAICNSLKFEKAEIYLEGIYFGNKLSLFFLAHSQVEAARFLDAFFGYLRKIEFP